MNWWVIICLHLIVFSIPTIIWAPLWPSANLRIFLMTFLTMPLPKADRRFSETSWMIVFPSCWLRPLRGYLLQRNCQTWLIRLMPMPRLKRRLLNRILSFAIGIHFHPPKFVSPTYPSTSRSLTTLTTSIAKWPHIGFWCPSYRSNRRRVGQLR